MPFGIHSVPLYGIVFQLAVVLCAAAASGLTVPQAWRTKREADTADQQADPSLLLYSTAMPSNIGFRSLDISGLPIVHSPLVWRKRRDVSAVGQDQQADPSLLMYSALPAAADISSIIGLKTIPVNSVAVTSIHSPLIWRKKRDTADQQVQEATIMYNMPMPLTTNVWGNNAFMVPLLKK